uniref:Uncharacterized protein n=1 Tax=Ursus maritimus TaxID=29073 RepID=A0A452VI26_URSMA
MKGNNHLRCIYKKFLNDEEDHAKLPAFCLSCVADVFRCCHVRVPTGLLKDLLPRPVTLVLEHSQELSKDLNPFLPLIGIWIPDPAFVANLSSQAGSQNVFEFQNLWPQLSLVIDGGPTEDGQSPEYRLGSTTVDLCVSGKFGIIHPPKEVWAAPLTGILLVNPGGRRTQGWMLATMCLSTGDWQELIYRGHWGYNITSLTF